MIALVKDFSVRFHMFEKQCKIISLSIQSKTYFSIYTTKLSLNLFLKSCNNGKNIHIMKIKGKYEYMTKLEILKLNKRSIGKLKIKN